MKLIDNAKSWWRMAVMQVAAMWAIVISVWPLLPEAQRSDLLALLGIPPQFIGGVAALVMFLSLLAARVKKQDALHPKDEQ
ncbi:hypothetical protein [Hydrogenophaga sp.]|uniref:DUF7940 domain-containing protein n=1 Tax=Hydrogenophaga sp. TaxID=1904254 RepID=UPI0027301078|nr:hypothetical protein [Hydrogenophaga sp.]MDP2018980.1 hypothetical protein [Hydrogenophaga sp.]MDP3164358.1 hypothetical protein [Hydrogenophaga sp.]